MAALGGLLLALFALGLAILLDLRRKNRQGNRKLNLPPGPRGVPVLGSMPIFAGLGGAPHHVITDLGKHYGPLLFFRLGSTPCIVASSPEVCREVFKNQDQVFASRPHNSAVEHILYRGKGIGFSPYGEHWRQVRKLVTMELLTARRTNQFAGVRVAESSAMLRSIYDRTVYGNGEPVNMRVLLKALSFNLITQVSFSRRFFEYESQAPARPQNQDAFKEINPEEAREFTQVIEEAIVLLGQQLIGDFIPFLSFLDWFSGYKARMIKCHHRLNEFVSRIVEEHKKHPTQGPHDFVDALLSLQQGEDGAQHVDDVMIKALCLDMVIAGTDTTANTIEWALAEIVRHPEVAAKLQEELNAVVGKERWVIEADIPNLPYLRAVVKEAFRFHPPGALNVPHMSTQQTKVMGYDIPENTMLFTNAWAMHRDPALWDNPMLFRPERFIENPEIDLRGQDFQLLPFGSGRRGCPGVNLGVLMVQYFVAKLVQGFDWAPPKGMRPQDLDIEEAWGLALTRANILKLLPTPRLASHLY